MSGKSKKGPKDKPPREIAEINKEFSALISQAGQVQYQAKVYQDELELINERLYEVNVEANKRNQLDAEKKETKDVVQ